LKLQFRVRAEANQPNAAPLPGLIRPYDLAIGLNRRMSSGKGELQVAMIAFYNGAHDLAAQSFFTDIEQDSAGVGSESDVGQLIKPFAQVCAAFGMWRSGRGLGRSGRHGRLPGCGQNSV
jgi:hypothetical protein